MSYFIKLESRYIDGYKNNKQFEDLNFPENSKPLKKLII
jgi:hypothetical protein